MTDHDDLRWLALCMASETSRPTEWPLVGQVLRNRRDDPAFPSTYQEVVLQRRQFSYFNWAERSAMGSEEIFWRSVRPDDRLPRPPYWLWRRIFAAYEVALVIDDLGLADPVFGYGENILAGCLWFYSPRSMVPRGVKPSWWDAQCETVPVPGLDPDRFTFGRRRRALRAVAGPG